MADKDISGKVEIKIGNLSFSAEGDQAWLSEQLAKVIEAAGTIKLAEPSAIEKPDAAFGAGRSVSPAGSLSSYLKAKGGEAKQVQRFLATAGWLRRRGDASISTASVTKALADNHQKRLGNAADCLNQNCAKGYCEKSGDGFYITPEGLRALGEG